MAGFDSHISDLKNTDQSRPTQTLSKTDRETVGAQLRQARADKGLSQEDVAKLLKLPLHHIIAIEEDRADSLPHLTYAAGWVRAYARAMRIDAEGLVADYKVQMADTLPAHQNLRAHQQASAGGPFPLRPILVGITTLMLAVGAGAGWAYLSGFNNGLGDTGAIVSAPPEAGVLPVAQTAREPNRALHRVTPPAEVVLDTDEDTADTAAADPAITYTYKITALDLSWVKLTDADGMELANQIMHPGQQLRLERDAKMTLTTGNLAGLAIEINGEELPASIRQKARAMGTAMRSLTLDATAFLSAMDKHFSAQ